ncbi:M15 family metallopeptidase [Streptomyces sp. NPDC005374]|uniref:M15 family metallopeptidase n=1 Tax=Streptomyces sp. NPDC005374 TaxID=3364713 RepID=UPI003694ABB7
MPQTPLSARATPRRIGRPLVLVLLLVAAVAVTAALGYRLLKPPATSSAPSSSAPASLTTQRPGHLGALGEADGVVSDDVTVFDDRVPAVANLDPDLLEALRRAATDAADDGVTFSLNSGWRSPAYQDELLRRAVSRYGSEDEAARWVATASTSPHVSGHAVDLAHSDATAWLSGHGARYGLCPIYRNEPWHYELRPEAIFHGCPRMYADPTQDPRMHK